MDALILVDLQYDFLPGGALAVNRGDEVLPVACRLAPRFPLVVATQDWHPADHASFAANHPGLEVGTVVDLDGVSQVLWPVHCVQETRGAQLHPSIAELALHAVFRKGTDRQVDSYSGFYDDGYRKDTGLADYLRQHQIETVWVLGLATDYCVQATALDARKCGFRTNLIVPGCRAVDWVAGDGHRALQRMKHEGVRLIEQESDVPDFRPETAD